VTRFLLETSLCVALLRGRAPRVFDRLQGYAMNEAAVSTITLAELQYGVAKSARPAHNAVVLAEFCAPLAILPFGAQAADTYGGVRAALERAGTPIGPLDTLIAAHALAMGLTLVTNNEREFRRVVGLHVENWLAD